MKYVLSSFCRPIDTLLLPATYSGAQLLVTDLELNLNSATSVLDNITKQFGSTSAFINVNSAKIPSAMVNKIINQFGDLQV